MKIAGRERWKPVVGYEFRYEVSSLGNVRRVSTQQGTCSNRTIIGGVGHGHRKVDLWRNGRRTSRRVCDLILLAFRGTPRAGQSAHFRDGRHTNLRLTNLTYRKNIRSKAR